jgi:phage shock protein A
VKATENVQRAQSAVAARYSGTDSKMRTAADSLERIKQKQAEKSARFAAAEEIAATENSDELSEKLKAAGITKSGTNAQDVLARLKAKKK